VVELPLEVVVEGRRDRFFGKKHCRWALCFRDFSRLLGGFGPLFLGVF
jgi:hypothetical protein